MSWGLDIRVNAPGSCAKGPWPGAGRRLRAAPRGTGWGPVAGRGRRSGGRGPSPWRGLRNPPRGGRRRRGGPRRGRRAGGASWGRASRELRCPPVRLPQALPEPAEPPEPRASGPSRAQVSGRPWGEGASQSLGRVGGVSTEPEACAPRPEPLGDRAGAGRPGAGGP